MKNNNLILITLFATLSIIVILSTITSIHSQGPDNILTELLEYEDKLLDKQNTKVNTTDHVPKFFAIQHAKSGSISEINETVYSLELNDVSDKTILFSDRPDRVIKSVTTTDFIGNWTMGIDSYAVNSPNTVIVVDEQGVQDTVIVELSNPVYSLDKKTLKYNVTPDNAKSIDLPNEFGRATLVIDPDTVAPSIT
ncbi:MAG: hypothetical protein ACPKQO_11530 [Nitrososphaeraceae archaeon]